MTKRKIMLLCACGLLLCIYIVQLTTALRSPIKNKTLNAEIDKIIIEHAGNTLVLTKSGDDWVAGEHEYPANMHAVNAMVNAIKDVRILSSVDKAGHAAVDERYEINTGSAIVVTAYEQDSLKRTLTVGKTSATGSQSYILLDGGKDIYLASGRLRDTFDKSVDDMRSKSVYALDSNALFSIAQTMGNETIAIKKSGEPALWQTSDGTPSVDGEKAANWANSLASLSVNAWLEDNFMLPAAPTSVTVIEAENKLITVTVYMLDDGDEAHYYGTCSETPYKFEMSQYTAGKFMKTRAELYSE
ncbi:MAG: DUF4340 domain-containing protein [Treponema sp.]|nr:DUF4340 domain-containing protein [Treponema sp.]